MKYFEVSAKCGHVGKNNYLIKNFYIKTYDKKTAALLVRHIPRVKHHHKDAIISVKEINKDLFNEGINKNKNDPYFQVSSIQEQIRTCDFTEIEIFKEIKVEKYKKKRKGQYLRYKEKLDFDGKELRRGYSYGEY